MIVVNGNRAKSICIVIYTLFYTVIFHLACKTKDQKETNPAVISNYELINELTAGSIQSKMNWIEGGSSMIGSNDSGFSDAQPIHAVTVNGPFQIYNLNTSIMKILLDYSPFGIFIRKISYVFIR